MSGTSGGLECTVMSKGRREPTRSIVDRLDHVGDPRSGVPGPREQINLLWVQPTGRSPGEPATCPQMRKPSYCWVGLVVDRGASS